MVRLLWFFLLAGIVFWLLKRAFSPGKRKAVGPEEAGEEMVQDPVCNVYVPKKQAVVLKQAGKETRYFCSTRCRDKFLGKDAS